MSNLRPTLTDRQQHLLKVLVERYIEDAQPVGSRSLARDSGLDLSPATIRNVMADLEDLGLVSSPHTSAGRIPTVAGYRIFVDSLVTCRPVDDASVRELRSVLRADIISSGELLARASQMLSGVTNLAGLVMVPRRSRVAFRHIEFLPLAGNRVLAILVTDEREVHNRILHTDRDYAAAELEQAANFLNQQYAGRDLNSAREQLIRELRATREHMNERMASIIAMAEQVMGVEGEADSGDYVLSGQTNLMQIEDLADMRRLRDLFEAFTEKQQILHLLEKCVQANGVKVFIGEESGYQPLDGCSVVASQYQVDGEVIGVLGVIGPTRMAYDRVIPVVDITARLLSAALKQP